jgi:hypothetical protein
MRSGEMDQDFREEFRDKISDVRTLFLALFEDVRVQIVQTAAEARTLSFFVELLLVDRIGKNTPDDARASLDLLYRHSMRPLPPAGVVDYAASVTASDIRVTMLERVAETLSRIAAAIKVEWSPPI